MPPPNNPTLDWQGRIISTIAWWMKPQVYVELGTAEGKTYRAVSEYAKECYACDVSNNSKKVVDDIKNSKFYVMKTSVFSKIWDSEIKKLIDLIFIDADHESEAALNDALNFYEWLTPDTGLMALHDTWPPARKFTKPNFSNDSYRVPAYLKAHLGSEAEILTIPTHFGLTLVRKVSNDWRNATVPMHEVPTHPKFS